MLTYEKRTVMKPTEANVPIAMRCDVCGKTIDPKNWFWVSTHHSDWGNDSFESLTQYDVCSDECAVKFAKDYLHNAYDAKAKGAHNTRVIEIEHQNSIREYDEERD